MGKREGNGEMRGRGDGGKGRKRIGRRKKEIEGGRGGRGKETRESLHVDVVNVRESERKGVKARAKTAEAAQGEKGRTLKVDKV